MVVPFNRGEMFPIANDEAGLQGLDPSLAIMDEIGFQPVTSWNALALSEGKRQRSLVWGMGTPGVDRDNALWHLRQLVREEPIAGFRFREWSADEGCSIRDRDQWRKANPAIEAGFLRESALVTALRLTPEATFRVFRLGQYVEGMSGWLGEDGRAIWDGLLDPYELVPKAPTWLGIDIGIKRDSTAVVSVQYRADQPEVLHAVARIWLPRKDEPVDVTDVMAHVRAQVDTYQVGAVAFDPRFFDVPAKMLLDEGIPMVEVNQSLEHMTPIAGSLYEMIRNGGLTHDDDPLFGQQVLSVVIRQNDRGFVMSKGRSRDRIDAAVALGMAVDRATHRKRPRGRVVVL